MLKPIAAALAALLVAPAATGPDPVVHVLNRVAFGPTAADVERVKAMGIDRYIDQQLHPERIDDAKVRERLTAFPTLTMSSRELATKYEQPLLEARKDQKKQAAKSGKDGDADPGDPAKASPEMRMMAQQANRVVVELSQQKLVRAVYSEQQLQEVLVDFWYNHFNVDARKGPDRYLITAYERDVIRPHVLGSFRALLGATAKSPAMLFYLDNWMSADPNAQMPRGRGRFPAPPNDAKQKRGLNENYARELMELHTLGVDGGYTQKDVTEVARALTGWTIERPREGGGFRFVDRVHDQGQKVVLGHVIARGGGETDGEQVLDILAGHPSTARFIATKLVRRFVSDTPPPALVDRAAARFRETRGDLREVVRTILTSKEFMAPEAMNAKAKTPFEFLVSALRATGGDVDPRLVRTMQEMGMPLYQCQPPTGYADTADAWINTGALVTRMNIATRLASRDQQLAQTLGSPEFQRR